LVLWLGACDQPRADAGAEPSVPLTPLAVAVDGCNGLFTSNLCLRGADPQQPESLILWTDEPLTDESAWTLTVNGMILLHRVTFHSDAVGSWWVIDAPLTSGRLQLRHADARSFTLELRELSRDYVALRERAIALNDKQRADEAREQLRVGRAARAFDEHEDYLLECLDARIASASHPAALERLEARAAALGDMTCRATAHRRPATKRLDDGIYVQVEDDLAVLRAAAPLSLRNRIFAEYVEGVLEQRRGQLDRSRVRLEHVLAIAERTQSRDLQEVILEKLCGCYWRLGYVALARASEARIGHKPSLRANLYWYAVQHREDEPGAPVPDVADLLQEFPANTKTGRNLRLNMAVAHTQDRDFEAAAESLAQVDRHALDYRGLVWASLVDARVAAGRGQFELARASLRGTLVRATQADDAEYGLRVQLELARLELRQGDVARAREHYAAAHELTRRRVLALAPHASRSMLATRQVTPVAEYLQLLRALGEAHEQELRCVLLSASKLHVQGLAARSNALTPDPQREKQLMELENDKDALQALVASNWDLALEDVPQFEQLIEKRRQALAFAYAQLGGSPEHSFDPELCAAWTASAHARLLMHPLGETRWLFGFELAGQTTWFEIERSDPSPTGFVTEVLGLLESRGHFDAVTQLTVIGSGSLAGADWHTPLSTRTPLVEVRYSLGFGSRDAESPQAGRTGHALVHVSTAGELPHAEAAGDAIARRLADDWSIARAWPKQLDDAPALLLYVGHGHLAGEFGWDSYVELADGQRLSSTEVIARRWGPDVVVLGTCEGGAKRDASLDVDMNMATAFVLAGARLVIASDVSVPPESGAELLERLFATPLPTAGAGAELQRRLTLVQAADPRFGSWRVWVP
jgi:hypothetical protein